MQETPSVRLTRVVAASTMATTSRTSSSTRGTASPVHHGHRAMPLPPGDPATRVFLGLPAELLVAVPGVWRLAERVAPRCGRCHSALAGRALAACMVQQHHSSAEHMSSRGAAIRFRLLNVTGQPHTGLHLTDTRAWGSAQLLDCHRAAVSPTSTLLTRSAGGALSTTAHPGEQALRLRRGGRPAWEIAGDPLPQGSRDGQPLQAVF